MTLDAPTQAYIEKSKAVESPPLWTLGPQKARAATAIMSRAFGPGPAVASRIVLENLSAGVRALTLIPEGAVRGLIVHLHGGGWVVGSPEEYEAFGRVLAVQTGCVVALPWYRLAPEHPAPAAADDAWTAVVDLMTRVPAVVGRDGLPLIVSGDSAGGNLAIGVTQRALRGGGPPIAHQLLVYPMVDPSMSSASYRDPANQLIFDRELLAWFWHQYAPTEEQRALPEVDVQAGALRGLPSATVITAEHDVLRDEGETYALALQEAGVPVRLERLTGQAHGFLTMTGLLPASATAVEIISSDVECMVAGNPGAG